MIRVQMIRQDTRHPSKRHRHQGRASCEVAGRRFEAEGPAPIYKLATLLWLHGHGGEEFEVWDDRSPFGKPGGLAMRGQVRNWASFETPKGMPMFRMKSKLNPDFTPEQRAAVIKAVGVVVSCDAGSRETLSPRRATRPSDGPGYPQEKDRAPAALVTASRREVA
ncbi:MAG: hypothetical protein V3U93_07520 [Alphaproteobacteria bacterium]